MKKRFILVVGLGVIVGGGLAYLYFTSPKAKKEENSKTKDSGGKLIIRPTELPEVKNPPNLPGFQIVLPNNK